MNMKKTNLFLGIIAILVAFSIYFILPTGYDKNFNFLKWKLGLDLIGGAHLVYDVDLSAVSMDKRNDVSAGLRDVIERRVNLFGVSEPQVYLAKSGETQRLVVELAGIKDVNEAIKQIGETPTLTFSEVELDENKNPKNFIPTELSGKMIENASISFQQLTGRPSVSLKFSKEGAVLFEKITEKNIGKPLAVFLDGQLMQMPTVQAKISGGNAEITGNFSVNEAQKIVERFNAGALPAPIKLVSQETIGASLGSHSLKQVILAGVIGTIAVALFMIFYYQMFGFVSALALFIYIVISLAVFKLFSVTMTLSGIAGFILSIGMAVDANILIFERTKEEFKGGESKAKAIENGFNRAWPSIRDSNVTTVITSLVLYSFTTGFVKGFALTLLIGVVVSIFSAINVSRNLVRYFIK